MLDEPGLSMRDSISTGDGISTDVLMTTQKHLLF